MQHKASLIAIFTIMLLTMPHGSAVPGPLDATDEGLEAAAGVVGADDGPACDLKRTATAVLDSPAYQAAYDHFDGLPGFVDLHFVLDGSTEPYLLAIFDLEVRGDDTLPAPIGPVLGLDVRTHGERFERLVPAPVPTSADEEPIVPSACAGRISPGARISTPIGGCSLNFIFRDSQGSWYAGSAGHCFRGVGDRASVPGLGQVGTVVYNVNGGIGRDFALIHIDTDQVQHVDPSMCHWGGPTTLESGSHDLVNHYGFGVGHGTTQATRARSGATTSVGANSFTFMGAVASGDSGSGARLGDGSALGTITHVNMGLVVVAHSAPYAYGTTATRGVQLAEAATGLDLTLQTAPVRGTP